ncbi:lys-63-specific deubiquitinase BRCC36-like [Pocillopora damicornis]|uniref:lys-63-specific deubiquitinase BRCC36-like n=1 Tax=Pocillopora damicornis TaxID=46731 RepID=UPI000F557534|nr:lys-63-specific deubiquitinase BRCC36-like [Pocillopora damicornis]
MTPEEKCKMAVGAVKIEADAYMVCLTHALSTEREEVMGLLIGEVEDERVAHIYSVIMLQRLDKRKDRVEISPEQLSDASTQAERLGMLTSKQRPMRVIGWYHSHPHITVWPSHVDLRTQASYQFMDAGFVGLIFSCFNTDTNLGGHLKVYCFQSVNIKPEGSPPQYQRADIELQIVHTEVLSKATLNSLSELPQILSKEEEEAYSKTLNSKDLLTAVHNSTVFTKALCQLMEVMCGPLLQTLENRLQVNLKRTAALETEKEMLEKEINSVKAELQGSM